MVDWDLDRACSLDSLFIFYYFFHFLRGHQELSINTSHAIFGEVMSMW